MPDFSNTISVLRRWESFSDSTPLPGNFAQWKQQNGNEYLRLAKADPELVALLDGRAPAGLVADAIQGKLSPIPKSPEQRQEEATKAEVQQLVDANPYRSGNLTQALRLEQLNPAAAKRLRQESGVQSPAEKKAAAEAAQQRHEKALAANVEAGRLQMQARAMEAARQSLNP